VLLHRREAHRVVRRQFGDTLASVQGAQDDVAPRRVGEGGEDMVDIVRGLH
jgi:hypothetical protein